MSLEEVMKELVSAVQSLDSTIKESGVSAPPKAVEDAKPKKPSRVRDLKKEEVVEAPEDEEEKAPPVPKKRTKKTIKMEITEDTIREVGTKVIKMGRSAEFKDLLEEFGASKTSEIEESDYAEIVSRLEAILAKPEDED